MLETISICSFTPFFFCAIFIQYFLKLNNISQYVIIHYIDTSDPEKEKERPSVIARILKVESSPLPGAESGKVHVKMSKDNLTSR